MKRDGVSRRSRIWHLLPAASRPKQEGAGRENAWDEVIKEGDDEVLVKSFQLH
jgi:hypothetical protein